MSDDRFYPTLGAPSMCHGAELLRESRIPPVWSERQPRATRHEGLARLERSVSGSRPVQLGPAPHGRVAWTARSRLQRRRTQGGNHPWWRPGWKPAMETSRFPPSRAPKTPGSQPGLRRGIGVGTAPTVPASAVLLLSGLKVRRPRLPAEGVETPQVETCPGRLALAA